MSEPSKKAINVFDDWNFENGCLFLGPDNRKELPGAGFISRNVKEYVTKTSDKLCELIKQTFVKEFPNELVYRENNNKSYKSYSEKFFNYKNEREREYTKISEAYTDYRIKSSKNKEYCAVYSDIGIHCDFYQQITSNVHGTPLNVGKYLFTLTRNTYRSGEWILDFVNHPDTNEQLFLFNSQHGILDVYDMTGKIKFEQESNDIFFKRLEWINDKYFLLHYWIWQPFDYVDIYSLDDFLRNRKELTHNRIWADYDSKPYPKVENGKLIIDDKIIDEFSSLSFSDENNEDEGNDKVAHD